VGLEPGRESAYLPQLPERALTGRNLAEDLCGDVRPEAATRARLRKALAAVGLEGMPLSRRSARLSTGERRRLTLALLHLSAATAWALDEPDAGLDAMGRKSLEVWLGREEGHRLWIASHRWGLYEGLKPWTLILESGGVVTSGSLDVVFREPRVRELLLPERV
jgi:energy-coupling factor transporter ATP-binding protein EcfA2